MALKSIQDLLDELPDLIKRSDDFQVDKTVGTPGLYDIIKDIIDSLMPQPNAFPIGSIINWSGSIANIPTNWVLCNGSNGTPNLRDRFVPGASGIFAPGARGGSDKHSHSGSIGGTSLNINQIPGHAHTYNKIVQVDKDILSYDAVGDKQGASYLPQQTSEIGGGPGGTAVAHTHEITGTDDNEVILPPYWALAFIMFKGIGYVPGPTEPDIVITDVASNLVSFTISDTIANGLNLQYSSDSGSTWSTIPGNTISQRDLGFAATDGMYIRLQSRDNLTNYSNVWVYVAPIIPVIPTDPPGTLIGRYFVGGGPQSIVVDSNGICFIYSLQTNAIYRLDLDGNITLFKQLSLERGRDSMAIDSQNNLYLSQRFSGVILKITPDGLQTNFATITDSTNSYKELLIGADDSVYVKRQSPFGIDKISPSGVVDTLWYSSPYSTYKMKFLPNGNIIAMTSHIVSTILKNEFITISPGGALLNSSPSYNSYIGLGVDPNNGAYAIAMYGGSPIHRYDPSYTVNTSWSPTLFEAAEQVASDDENLYIHGETGRIARYPFDGSPPNLSFGITSPAGNPYGGGTAEKMAVDKVRKRISVIHSTDETVTVIAI